MAANYQNKFYEDYEELQIKYEKKCLEYKIAKDGERRAKQAEKYAKDSKQKLVEELKCLKNENQALKLELARLKGKENIDGTNSGIPTSMTPIGKKKVIPNFAKNTGGKIGRKEGHKKDKLEKEPEEKIDKHVSHEMEDCPCCHKGNIEKTGKIISKQVKDYHIIVETTSHDFVEYKCMDCGKVFHEDIPNHMKEDIQYGSSLKSVALTLTNVGNVPFNKIRRILNGLSMNEINPSEGYLAKLQKVSSKKLSGFIKELEDSIRLSELLQWDDTVIMINKQQSCMRYYGNDDISLFKAHEKKNKEGLDKDDILNKLKSTTVVEHDHNKVNYNDDYCFINAECCQHLLRDLRKVEINIPSRTWCKDMISLFQEYDHKRKELINKGIEEFPENELNNFIMKLDHLLLQGLEENEADTTKPYYSSKELTLIWRLMEYRDNYIYWLIDFGIPFTNNLSERNLRGIKSKMKVSGQFQNVERAEDYANIRSYIETCRIHGKNEYDCLSRLVEGKPYTFSELIASKK